MHYVTASCGVGKSFVASALAQKACRDGYSALYTRAAALFRDLAMARTDGSLRLMLGNLGRIHLLLIAAWPIAPQTNPAEVTQQQSQTAVGARHRQIAKQCRRPCV